MQGEAKDRGPKDRRLPFAALHCFFEAGAQDKPGGLAVSRQKRALRGLRAMDGPGVRAVALLLLAVPASFAVSAQPDLVHIGRRALLSG